VSLRDVYKKHHEEVEFITVYVREAHPSDKWWLGESRTQRAFFEWTDAPARTDILDPITLEERREVADACHKTLLGGEVPLYVDTIDDHVSTLYTGKPTRIYLLGRDGRVVYNPGIGPFGFNPTHLDREIEAYLEAGS
jgi:hypothetical protein